MLTYKAMVVAVTDLDRRRSGCSCSGRRGSLVDRIAVDVGDHAMRRRRRNGSGRGGDGSDRLQRNAYQHHLDRVQTASCTGRRVLSAFTDRPRPSLLADRLRRDGRAAVSAVSPALPDVLLLLLRGMRASLLVTSLHASCGASTTVLV